MRGNAEMKWHAGMSWHAGIVRTTIGLTWLILLAQLGCGSPGPDVAADEAEPGGGGVVTLWTDALELFMEYPPQIAGQPGDVWAIHLNFLDSWEPVREGSLTLRLVDSSGQEWTFEESQPARAGIFTPVPVVSAAGEYTVSMELVHRGQTYPVEVGAIRVYGSQAELPEPEEEEAGGIPFLKEQQWEVDFAVALAEVHEVQRTARVSGELIVPPNRVARIAAPLSGLALGGGTASWPTIGARVRAGQTLATLAPTDTDGSFAALRGRVERLEREVARAERLYAAEAIPERRLVEARHDLEIARAAFDAIGGDQEGAYTYRVRSPIAGVLTERQLSPGQRGASEVTGATFTVEGGTAVHQATRLVSVGDVIDPTSRTLPATLAVEDPDRALKVGMLAQARVWLGDPTSGTAVPADAVQDEDGLAVVYVEIGGETFERRVVRLGPTDGVWTIVTSGVLPGDRVVTRGAYQVRLASLGDTEDLGAGHQH